MMSIESLVENVGLDDALKDIPLVVIIEILAVVFQKYELKERKDNVPISLYE